jgi:LDH2 family malate/lactate/ureidoglycolate dehydrogenase
MTLGEAAARDLAARAFARAGVPERPAAHAAEILTLAEMMGIGTHGLARVRLYVDRIAAGGIDPAAILDVRAPAPALRLVDGRNGLGPATAREALSEAMTAAGELGLGAAFCRGGSHLGALAPCLWIAAEAGFACVMTTNTAPMIAPAGGREARIGNNPVGIAVPHPAGDHAILDMALSVVSRSRVRAAARAGTPIPADWATDAAGRPTTDPSEAMHGLMRAIGGDKGANLALCLDLLAGGLSGAAMLSEIPNAGENPGAAQNLGYMIVLVDARRLMPDADRAAAIDRADHILSGSAPLDPGTRIRLPGARAIRALRRARRDGLDLDPQLLQELRSLSGTG